MKYNKKDCSGVAIIIVLGMLALLMMMGVAFSVSMRIERRSAGNYSHSVATKNLVWAGLARAMEDVETKMDGHVYPPDPGVWTSSNPSAGDQSYVKLGQGEALDYIPGAWHGALPSYKSNWVNFDVEWGVGVNRATNVPGRYAYLIVNCSDFIDANYAGGEVRGGGTNVNEMQIEDFPSIDNWAEFKTDRDNDIRYETVQELNELNRGISTSKYFSTYSRYPLGYLLNGGTAAAVTSNVQLVHLGGDEVELEANKIDIINALDDAVLGGESEVIFTNLLDYVDKDCVPRNLTSASVERVPMINEIRMRQVRLVKDSDTEFRVRARVDLENTYPFVSRIDHTFSTKGVLEFTLSPEGLAPIKSNVTFSVDSEYQVGPPVAQYYSVTVSEQANFSTPNTNFNYGVRLLGVTNVINEASEGFVAGTPVDLVNIAVGSSDFELKTAGSVFSAANGNIDTINNDKSLEARDPRYNWYAGDNTMWRSPRPGHDNTIDPPAINSWATGYFGRRLTGQQPKREMDESMHVSDRGYLASVGELGNLLRSGSLDYWTTIRIFDQTGIGGAGNVADRDEIYKFFTLSSNTVQRGVVNLNTMEPAILDAAITNMPSMYPESGNMIAYADAVAIRNVILGWRAGNEFYNVDDLAGIDWRVNVLQNRSDLELEAMFSYSAGLFGTRQNLFAIVVAASPVTTGMGEYARQTQEVSALGSKRAIVYVWRDPFPDADGNHECFVQFFKWL